MIGAKKEQKNVLYFLMAIDRQKKQIFKVEILELPMLLLPS